ncbi:patatin-like phospholipase family protein [Chenggangzhangella methanolivorans]|uniref:patatin-like phospholipase family protein n=1 Tax=Chenggangzhangella methanolivorans TaxID=1437009 RepID=UPI003D186E23
MFPSLSSLISRPASIAETGDAGAPEPQGDRRPVFALALGGGIARGWAHIGVLKTLDAAGVRPDIVTAPRSALSSAGAGRPESSTNSNLGRVRSPGVACSGLLDVSFGGAGLIGGGRLKAQLEANLGDIAIEDLDVRFAAIATELHHRP